MARIEFYGIEEYFAKLARLGEKTTGVCKRAIYDGAAVLADAVKAEVQALPTTDRNAKKGETQGILEYEKQGLLDGMGIARMRDDNGKVETRVDFDGYNRLKSKRFPNGHPNAMVARSINSGTSMRPKNPFMARAVRKARDKANQAMAARLDADIEKIMK